MMQYQALKAHLKKQSLEGHSINKTKLFVEKTEEFSSFLQNMLKETHGQIKRRSFSEKQELPQVKPDRVLRKVSRFKKSIDNESEYHDQSYSRNSQALAYCSLNGLPKPQLIIPQKKESAEIVSSNKPLRFKQLAAQLFRKFLGRFNLQNYFTESALPKQKVEFTLIEKCFTSKQTVRNIMKFLESFKPVHEIIPLQNESQFELCSDQNAQFKANMKQAQNYISLAVTPQKITLLGFNLAPVQKFIHLLLSQAKKKPSKLELTLQEHQFLEVFHSNSELYSQIFQQKSVSKAYLDPFNFKSYVYYQGLSEKEMRFIFSKFSKKRITLTHSVKSFLMMQDEQLEDITVLSRLELIYESVVRIKKLEIQGLSDQNLLEEPKSSQLPPGTIGLKIDKYKESCETYELTIYSSSHSQVIGLEKEIQEIVAQIERSKRFIEIEEAVQFSPRIGKPVQWPWQRIVNHLGLQWHKSESALHFEKNNGVILFTTERKKQKGILVYGPENALKQAVLELSLLINLTNTLRSERPIPRVIGQFLKGTKLQKIRKLVKEVAKSAELFKIGESKLVLYLNPKQSEEVEPIMNYVINQCKEKLRIEVLSPQFSLRLSELKRIAFRTKRQITMVLNEAETTRRVYVPRYFQKINWKRSELDGSNEKNYEPKAREVLEKNFQGQKKEFSLNQSKFSLSALQESGWFEERKAKIYRVKREEVKIPEENKRVYELQPKGLLLIGLEKEIEMFKLSIKHIEGQLQQESSSLWLDKELDQDLANQIQRKHNVVFSIQSSQIRVTGVRHKEAAREYEYTKFQTPEKITLLSSESQEAKNMTSYFLQSWRSEEKIEVQKVYKIWDPDTYFPVAFLKQASNKEEQLLFKITGNEPNLFTNSSSYIHKPNFQKQGVCEAMVYRVLTREKLRSKDRRYLYSTIPLSQGQEVGWYDSVSVQIQEGEEIKVFENGSSTPTYRVVYGVRGSD